MAYVPPVKVPLVARKHKRGGAAKLGVVLFLIGGGVFMVLANSRAAYSAQASALPPLNTSSTMTVAPAPFPAAMPLSPPLTIPLVAPQPALASAYPIAVPPLRRADDGAAERARLAAPALIVDLAQARPSESMRTAPLALSDGGNAAPISTVALGEPVSPVPTASVDGSPSSAQAAAIVGAAAQSGGTALAGSTDTGTRDLNADERFAARAGRRETEVSRAYLLPSQDRLVPLGTIIGAVMETALNSDVPGFARAITTRDVLSFDGSQVVIPAGSHVVGEYKSGVAQGASRIFIVWSRLVRPDGVAVGLASPATDDLGGGGLGGKVSRHFLERFGGAVLLSVLTGGLNAFTQSLARGSTVVVSSSTEATSLAGEASRGTDIPPTIKTKQGAAVRIFVARDLDFSGVGPAL